MLSRLTAFHRKLGAFLLLGLMAGCPQEGSAPPLPGGTEGTPPDNGTDLPNEMVSPLPFPSPPPTEAWTRTAPVTLVNERGEQVHVIQGHHAHLQVLRLLADRAWVTCDGCRLPVEGWIQRNLLLPVGYVGTPSDRASAAFALSIFVAEARRLVRAGVPPAGLDEIPSDPGGLVRLLDQGFKIDRNRAIAPPWSDEPGFTGSRAELLKETGGWLFSSLSMVPDR